MTRRELELPKPSVVEEGNQAIELARIWAVDGRQYVTFNAQMWPDPAAWGIMLVDFARHVARAYAEEGVDEADALARVRAGFDAEWLHPMDDT